MGPLASRITVAYGMALRINNVHVLSAKEILTIGAVNDELKRGGSEGSEVYF